MIDGNNTTFLGDVVTAVSGLLPFYIFLVVYIKNLKLKKISTFRKFILLYCYTLCRLNALATRRQSTLSTVETPLAKAEASSPLIKLKPELGESSIAAAKGISVLSLLHPDSIEAVPERSTAPKAPLGRENQAIQPGPRQFGALPLFDSDTPEDEENDEVLQYLREQAERHPTDRIDRSAISAANLNSSSLYELANSGDKERTKRLHDEAEFESESLEGGHTDPKQRLLYLHKRHRNASMSDEKEDVDSYLV